MFKDIYKIWKDLKHQERKNLKSGLIFIGLFGLICIFILPLIFTIPAIWNWTDFSSKGPVGDLINGVAGPFIALLASVLTFLAFYIQYQANIEQRRQFLIALKHQRKESVGQEKTWRIERFENRYYELLQLHKSNVQEMNIGNKVFGRKCFVPMYYELRFCYITAYNFYKSTPDDIKKFHHYESIDLLNFAYTIFFYGIGFQSEKNYTSRFSDAETNLFDKVKPFLEKVQNKFEKHMKKNPDQRYYQHNLPISGDADDRTTEFYYYPFDGHINQLGHYYRHIFQSANYITKYLLLNSDEKYEYIKTLRAQLSNFEQLLLYYNSMAWFQNEWKELFTEYRLIKNLPIPLADFSKLPMEHFRNDIIDLQKRGIRMFELQF